MCKVFDKVKELELVTVNGTMYFGKKSKTQEVTVLSSAIEVSSGSSLKETVKDWLESDLKNELSRFEFEGNVEIGKRSLSEKQKTEVKIVCMQAAVAIDEAVPNLQASALRSI